MDRPLKINVHLTYCHGQCKYSYSVLATVPERLKPQNTSMKKQGAKQGALRDRKGVHTFNHGPIEKL